MKQNDIVKQEIDEIIQPQKQNAKNQKFESEENVFFELQRQQQLEQKKYLLDTARKWEFFQQYSQFLDTTKISSKLNRMLKQVEKQRQLLDQIDLSDLKKVLNNKSMLQRLVQFLQIELIKNQFQIVDQVQILSQNSIKHIEQIDIQISLINNTRTYEITELYCKYGRYAKKYTVLNIFQESFRHSLPMLGMGGMGEIYLGKSFKDQTHCAVKCSKIGSQSQTQLKSAIRQFFITDLLSSLQIAPKIIKNIGFDFIIFDTCVEFQLEKCQSFKINNIDSDLKDNLLFMHLLKIVHNDIKPSNIMYSPSFQKNIFIDFGISEHTNQSFGEKNWTKFKGTYQFCSQQMQNIVCGKKPEMIDLYKNDIIMLTKSFHSMKLHLKNSLKFQSIKNYQNNYDFEPVENENNLFYLENKTKFYLYNNTSKLKLNSQLREIFEQVQCLKDEDGLKNYIKQIFAFTSYFKSELSLQLLEQKLFKKFQQKLSLVENFIQQRKYFSGHEENGLKLNFLKRIQNERIDLLKNIESNSSQQINSVKIQNVKVDLLYFEDKIKIQNIQFILLNKNQAKKLKKEDYFELFINYSSIWFRNYKEASMSKKLRASTILKQIVIYSQNQKDFQYLKKEYFPDDSCILTEYKDLIWVYGYLLSYCFSEQTNQFKARFILVIVKQTILLNFKYCFFLDKAFVLYIKYLIRNKVARIFSLISIHKCQLIWLTNVHYSYIVLPKQQFQDVRTQIKENLQKPNEIKKFSLIQIRSAIINEVQTTTNQAKEYLKYKQKSLLAISSQVKQSYYVQNFISYDRLIQQIDNQIAELQNLEDTQTNDRYYQYLLTIMRQCYKSYYQQAKNLETDLKFKTKLLKIYHSLDKEKLTFPLSLFQPFKNTDQWSNSINLQKFLMIFDSKIDYHEISKYFFINLRLQLATLTNNKLLFARVVSILSFQPTFVCLNQQFMNSLSFYQFQIEKMLEDQENLQEIENQYAFIFQNSERKNLNQIIKQRYEQFFFHVINYYAQSLHQCLVGFKKSCIIKKSKKFSSIFADFQQTLQPSRTTKAKTWMRQKLNKQVQRIIEQNKDKIQQLMLTYNLLMLKLRYIQNSNCQIKNLILVLNQKQLVQCLYKISKNLHITNQEQNVLGNTSDIDQSLFDQINTNVNFDFYFLRKRRIGLENYKLKCLLCLQNEFIQGSFQVGYMTLSLFNLYDVLSQIILISSYVLWNNKLAVLLNAFNYQLNNLHFTKNREIRFCEQLIQTIVKLTGNNLHQTYLFTIFIHMLKYQHYLNQNRAVWKKILFLVCKNFDKYPKWQNQQKFTKLKRKEQILLRSLIFRQDQRSYRNKMIMVRKWMKLLHDQSPFERKQSSYYIIFYLKQRQNHLENRFFQRIYSKKQKLMFNCIFSQSSISQQVQSNSILQLQPSFPLSSSDFSYYLTKQKIFEALLLQSVSTLYTYKFQNIQQKQKTMLIYEKKLKFTQRYHLINMQIFTSFEQYDFFTNFTQILEYQARIDQLEAQLKEYKQTNYKLWVEKAIQLDKVKKWHSQKEKQLSQNLALITKSQYYKTYEQIYQTQLKILDQERQKIIKELVKQDKLSYNKKQRKYETVRFHKCFQINFSKNDTLHQ